MLPDEIKNARFKVLAVDKSGRELTVNSQDNKSSAIIEMEELFYNGIFNHLIVRKQNGDLISQLDRCIE